MKHRLQNMRATLYTLSNTWRNDHQQQQQHCSATPSMIEYFKSPLMLRTEQMRNETETHKRWRSSAPSSSSPPWWSWSTTTTDRKTTLTPIIARVSCCVGLWGSARSILHRPHFFRQSPGSTSRTRPFRTATTPPPDTLLAAHKFTEHKNYSLSKEKPLHTLTRLDNIFQYIHIRAMLYFCSVVSCLRCCLAWLLAERSIRREWHTLSVCLCVCVQIKRAETVPFFQLLWCPNFELLYSLGFEKKNTFFSGNKI